MSSQKNLHFYFPLLNQFFSYFPSPSEPAIIDEETILHDYQYSKDVLMNSTNYAHIDQNSLLDLYTLGDFTIICEGTCLKDVFLQILSMLFPQIDFETKEENLKNTKNTVFLNFVSESNLKNELKNGTQKKIVLHYKTDILHWLSTEEEYILLIQITVLSLNYFHVESFNRTNPFKSIESNTLKYFPLMNIVFTCTNIIQHLEVYNNINNGLLSFNHSSISQYSKGKTTVLVLVRSLFRKKDFYKVYFFISKGEVLYKYHIGGNDVHVNDPFHMVNSKMGKIDDRIHYKELLQSVDTVSSHEKSIFLLNSCSDLTIFQDKLKMNSLILDLLSSEKLKFTHSTYSLCFDIDLCLSSEIIYDQIESKALACLSFPFILKFGGLNTDDHHKTIIVLSSKGLSQVVENEIHNSNCIDEAKKGMINLIIQEYVESKYVIKAYRINRRTFFIKRKLNQQMTIEKVREIGFLSINNKINEKSIGDISSNDIISSDIQKEIEIIMEIFERKTKKNLFGLDFLLEEPRKERLFLIDCNYFPGYKELKSSISQLMREHCLEYYKEFKKE